MPNRGRSKALPPPSPDDPLTAERCRDARQLLEWGVGRLAGVSGVSQQTIYKFERGVAVRPQTLLIIRATLEAAGVEFIDGDEPGVQLRKPPE